MNEESVNQLIGKFQDFIEKYYLTALTDNLRKDKNYIIIDFNDLSKYNFELAERLLDQTEDIIFVAELAIEKLDLENSEGTKVRFINLPPSQQLMVKNIRSQHYHKLYSIDGIIKQVSKVLSRTESTRHECPSCIPKGTLVLTPEGYIPIEKVKEVISLDENFESIKIKAKVVNTGKKQIWNINKSIKCSAEHKWFVYRRGITKVIQTKDLNIGDVLYKINDNLYNLQQKIHPTFTLSERENRRIFKTENLFTGLCKEILQPIPKGGRKDKIKQPRDNQIVYQGKEIIGTDSKHIKHKPQNYKKKIK